MRKIMLAMVIAAICLYPMAAFAGGMETTSSDLIDNAEEYDGQDVIYIGEVIGDILYRGDYVWINVSDGSNAIGIWADADDIKQIGFVGRYTVHGDTIRITGVFNRACAEHGGDFDIHASKIEIVEKGYLVTHAVESWKIIPAIVLFAGAAVLLTFILRKKSRR